MQVWLVTASWSVIITVTINGYTLKEVATATKVATLTKVDGAA